MCQKLQEQKRQKPLPKIGDYVKGVLQKTEETLTSKLYPVQFHREYIEVEYPFEGVVSSILFDFSFEVSSTDADGTPVSHWYDINSPSLLALEII